MINWTLFETGSHRTACPSCKRNDREKTLGLTINPGGSGVAHCFRCGLIETSRNCLNAYKSRPTTATKKRYERLEEYGYSIWRQCQPISGIAEKYLQSRRCIIPPKESHLRWHDSLKHPSGYVGAALVALVTDTLSGQPLTLHRTWITATGDKAKIDPPRMLLGNHTSKGGVIRLWPDEYVTNGLAVAEGIETALSLAWGFTPVWATIDAGHLKKLPVLEGIECLTIAVDQDEAGIEAAYHCTTNWLSAGCTVYLTNQKSNDLNDLLREATP